MSGIPNPTFDCNFDFQPIGQGLFYSGRVNDKRFVYDCGSASGSKYLNSAIQQYTDHYGAEKIDLLIVSHFHQDHVNGIKTLLSKTSGAVEVILPYLFPEERLMIAAEYAIKEDIDSLDVDYSSFLADPIGFFASSADIAQFTLLRPGNNEAIQENDTNQSVGEYGWFPMLPISVREFPELAAHADSQKISVRSDTSIFRIPQWGFRFYCQPGRATRDDIRKQLAALKEPLAVEDIPYVIANRLADLKDVYYSLFGGASGQNSTSIVCCHGPAIRGGRRSRLSLHMALRGSVGVNVYREFMNLTLCIGELMWMDYASPARFLLPPMTLLTGDANLLLSEFITHFQDELDGIGLASLPHHGSYCNYRRDFPSVMPNCQLWVASFGLGNSYKHPSKSVIDHVLDNDRSLLQCTESQGLSFSLRGWITP